MEPTPTAAPAPTHTLSLTGRFSLLSTRLHGLRPTTGAAHARPTPAPTYPNSHLGRRTTGRQRPRLKSGYVPRTPSCSPRWRQRRSANSASGPSNTCTTRGRRYSRCWRPPLIAPPNGTTEKRCSSWPEVKMAGRSSSSPTQPRWNYLGTRTNIATEYTGPLPQGYTIGTGNPVWLSAASPDGARGSFIIEAAEPPGPTVTTLEDIRSKIAWVYGGEGIEGYDSCLRSGLANIRFVRDREAYDGEPWVRTTSERIPFGQGAGFVVYERDSAYGDHVYWRVWLTGKDANLFDAQIVDDDDDPANGFKHTITTSRPLPGGTYRFVQHEQCGLRCRATTPDPGFEWVVMVGGRSTDARP